MDERPTVGQAMQALFGLLTEGQLESELVPVTKACGRVTARDILCGQDIPPFDRAAMDGYALLAKDTEGATESSPVHLRVVGIIVAGTDPGVPPRLVQGEAVGIMTGAPLPPGADAVVMAEKCGRVSDRVSLASPVRTNENVSRKGEDYRNGEVILRVGRAVRPWHVAALSMAGLSDVRVKRRLRVGILSTGTELVDVGETPGPGQIVNSNRPMLSSMVEAMGCEPVDLGIAPDRAQAISAGLGVGLASCDVVLSTGGSSVGRVDLVPAAISLLEGSVFVARGLRLRPGGATGVAVVGGKPVFVLSGYPVAAFTAFEELVKPTIQRLLGIQGEPIPAVRGRLTQRLVNRKGLRSYVRVRVRLDRGGYSVTPVIAKGSGLISTLTKAQGVVVLDESTTEREVGDEVLVRLTESVLPSEP